MEGELTLKKPRKSTTGKGISERKSVQHGITASENSKLTSSNVAKLGKCPECGKIVVRFAADIDTAICTCSSVVLVPLTVSIGRSEYEAAKRLAKEMEADGDGDRKRLLQGLLKDVFEVEEWWKTNCGKKAKILETSFLFL